MQDPSMNFCREGVQRTPSRQKFIPSNRNARFHAISMEAKIHSLIETLAQ
jgi:hypothetical protein